MSPILAWLVTLVMTNNGVDSVAPWWEVNSLDWTRVDEDFGWRHRRTGVEEQWRPSVGYWRHYRSDNLQSTPVEPWTSGYMCKNLRMVNASAFELCSVYEASAIGGWLGGDMPVRDSDGLGFHRHTFVQTPYRINRLPMRLPPTIVDPPPGCDTVRATIVAADAATVSATRWFPSVEHAKQLAAAVGGDYARFCTCELWLAESLDGVPEGRKIGFFCNYDGLSGELVQAFGIRERPVVDLEAADYHGPDQAIDLAAMKASLPELNLDQIRQSPAFEPLCQGRSLDHVIQQGAWRRFDARCTRISTIDGEEVAAELPGQRADEYRYWSPADVAPDDFYDLRFDDGVYVRIPKRLHPELEVCGLEIGCLTLHGDLHRVLLAGNRRSGMLHTAVYERWSQGK